MLPSSLVVWRGCERLGRWEGRHLLGAPVVGQEEQPVSAHGDPQQEDQAGQAGAGDILRDPGAPVLTGCCNTIFFEIWTW